MDNQTELKLLFKEYVNNIFIRTYLAAQTFVRIIIAIWALRNNNISLDFLPSIFIYGALADFISSFFAIPIITLFQQIKYARFLGHFVFSFILVFGIVGQIIFWDEFNSNFNFIAVDYLIYTHEIFGTLKESMPIYHVTAGIIFITFLLSIFTYKNPLHKPSMKLLIAGFILSITIGRIYDSNKIGPKENSFAHEISKNGPYEFFYAFFSNSLNYTQFYSVISSGNALKITRDKLQNSSVTYLNNKNLSRNIANPNKMSKKNVVIIMVESLNADFLQTFGNNDNITPELDKIIKESMLFTNIYATGTRTVRGLEALTLSIPPLPGSSIIRRSDNRDLFTTAIPFRENGYKTDFIYGGYSYFDNLDNFFKGNHFSILDRSNLSKDEISFSNIWGVADEDIFAKSIERFNRHFKNKKNFFSIIMTTSNHRPYNFPENRIDLPQGTRSAAVKYTDYAIGKFIRDSKIQGWFKDTIFVITADHQASSAGKTKLPLNKYHIPLIIYSPGNITPSVNNNLGSQIDIVPTLLSMLGFNYHSKFYGQDLIETPANRAFISTYQLLGYFKDDILVILSPKANPIAYRIENNEQTLIEAEESLIDEAIAYYQSAYELFTNGEMKEGL